MNIKSPYEFYGTYERREITKEQETEYFNYLMDCIKQINPWVLRRRLKREGKYDSDVDFDKMIGQIVVNFLQYHNHEGSFYWSRSVRMWDYAFINLKKLGLIESKVD
jgi:hypothetical protein